ncbi:hypothetical protein HDV03_004879 [Kappamyces sp. JEL0829]|nr:hypothetical protein HDV03_004879 [Kappamyces sp. JEL0829]
MDLLSIGLPIGVLAAICNLVTAWMRYKFSKTTSATVLACIVINQITLFMVIAGLIVSSQDPPSPLGEFLLLMAGALDNILGVFLFQFNCTMLRGIRFLLDQRFAEPRIRVFQTVGIAALSLNALFMTAVILLQGLGHLIAAVLLPFANGVSIICCAFYLIYDNVQNWVILYLLYQFKNEDGKVSRELLAEYRKIGMTLIFGSILDWLGVALYAIYILDVYQGYRAPILVSIITSVSLHSNFMILITLQLGRLLLNNRSQELKLTLTMSRAETNL